MNSAAENLFEQAHAAHRRKDAVVAERLCSQFLKDDPQNVAGNVLMGIVLAAKGDDESSSSFLERALANDSNCIEALIALSTVKVRLGKPSEGLELAARATELQPDDPDLYFHMGMMCVNLRLFPEAAGCFEKQLAFAQGNLQARQNFAMALRDAGREFDAVEQWEKLTAAAPKRLQAWINLGQLYLAHGRFEDAIQAADKAIALESFNSNAHLLKALALAENGRSTEAEPHLLKAIKFDSKSGIAKASLGFWYQEQGRFEEAHAVLEQAIELAPNHGFAYYNLLRAKKATESDRGFLSEIETLAKNPALHPRDKGYMQYALGKGHEDIGDFEAAIRHYDMGNEHAYQVWLSRQPWDRREYAEGFSRVIERFDSRQFETLRPIGTASELPIVIVGMIRSGTSLLEQILSSHPEIAGAGELPFWHKNELGAYDNNGDLEPELLEVLADRYLSTLREFSPNASRVTDKLPHNYAMLGLIHSALPQARIIHVRRNPIDNCLSVYTTAYQRPPSFAHSRENIVFAYREYLRLMEHWRSVLPAERFIEIDYETLVSDRESALRKLIAFCGLEWSDSLLNHQSNQRAVRTPSLWQVRQPIYKTSIERWRRFESWIPEFVELGS